MSNLTSTKVPLPSSKEIIAAVFAQSYAVFGLPDKQEIFRLADLITPLNPNPPLLPVQPQNWLTVRILKPSFALIESEKPPCPGDQFQDFVAHNFVVNLQVLSAEMNLCRLEVIYGSRTDNSDMIVFEGDEYPDARFPTVYRRIRVARDRGEAFYSVLASTRRLF